MSQTFDLIVFDWHGTLMNPTTQITHAIQSACADLGLPIPSDEQAHAVIGLDFAESLAIICPELMSNRYPEMIAAFHKHFSSNNRVTVLFDGVANALAELATGHTILAVATSQSRRGLTHALTDTGLETVFTATRTQDDCPSKPHPAMLLEMMAQFNIAPERTLMVGDTTEDLLMAKAAGTHAAGVLSGIHSREQLTTCPALGLFKDFGALYTWLKPKTA